jgi:hypothetical protein
MSLFTPRKFGWHRDSPDPRDLVPTDELVCSLLDRLEPPRAGRVPRADWSEYLPPAYDQCDLAASAALACVTLAACFERRASGRSVCCRGFAGSPRNGLGCDARARATVRTTSTTDGNLVRHVFSI